MAESAALLCQAPVQEPWSWWPAVQAAWQRGEHEQVRVVLFASPFADILHHSPMPIRPCIGFCATQPYPSRELILHLSFSLSKPGGKSDPKQVCGSCCKQANSQSTAPFSNCALVP